MLRGMWKIGLCRLVRLRNVTPHLLDWRRDSDCDCTGLFKSRTWNKLRTPLCIPESIVAAFQKCCGINAINNYGLARLTSHYWALPDVLRLPCVHLFHGNVCVGLKHNEKFGSRDARVEVRPFIHLACASRLGAERNSGKQVDLKKKPNSNICALCCLLIFRHKKRRSRHTQSNMPDCNTTLGQEADGWQRCLPQVVHAEWLDEVLPNFSKSATETQMSLGEKKKKKMLEVSRLQQWDAGVLHIKAQMWDKLEDRKHRGNFKSWRVIYLRGLWARGETCDPLKWSNIKFRLTLVTVIIHVHQRKIMHDWWNACKMGLKHTAALDR